MMCYIAVDNRNRVLILSLKGTKSEVNVSEKLDAVCLCLFGELVSHLTQEVPRDGTRGQRKMLETKASD